MDKLWKGRSKQLAAFKKQVSFLPTQADLVYGTLLGDACLVPNSSKTGFRLQVEHCLKQKDFVEWKYAQIKNLVLSAPKYQEKNHSWKFRTVSHPEFGRLHSEFYTCTRKKVLPNTIKDKINSFIFAIWYMDDGGLDRAYGQTKGAILNTQSYSQQENHIIQKVLWDRFGLETAIFLNHNKPRLRFPRRELKKLSLILKPHMIASMQYKLPP